MSKQRSHAVPRPERSAARPVSKPHDPSEREAQRAADVVARGGSVAGWSFSSVPVSDSSPAQRQDEGVAPPTTEDEEYEQAFDKASEAALATPQGKAVKDKILADPVVKPIVDTLYSKKGLALLVGGVGALGAAHKPLPIQPPKIPLDRFKEGLSMQVTWKGPVDAPDKWGLMFTYTHRPSKSKRRRPSDVENAGREAAAAARRLGELSPDQQRLEAEFFDEVVNSQKGRFTIPIEPAGEKKQEEKAPAQREPASSADSAPEHADVDDALSGPGRPLEPGTRRSMEARFGYDFSRVRVHDDARAASIDAAAFTVGEDVVFAPGRYDPATPMGRRLLAHELAHVVQQSRGARRRGGGGVVQRLSAWEQIGVFFGWSEGDFTNEELLEYLRKVTGDQHIEDDYDSDNKARAIARRYQTGDFWFELTAFQKILLIREMLSGPTLAEDEGEIVALLEVSDDEDLAAIFAPGQINVWQLECDIGGERRERLDLLLATRFVGGRDALVKGHVEARGYERRDFDPAELTALIDRDAKVEEIVGFVVALPPVVRERATRFLAKQRATLDRRATELGREAADEKDETQKEELRKESGRVRARRHTVDVSLQQLYRDVVGGQTKETLLERTAAPAPTPKERKRVEESQAPEVRIDPGTGERAKFKPKLPGEEDDYETKLRKALPDIIDGYWKRHAEGRGRVEHADPKKTHQLSELERIGNAGKLETDKVFGHLAKGRPLRADQPGRRGNIHDLFADYDEQMQATGPDELRSQARQQMFYFFASNGDVRALNGRHDASPSYDSNQRPLNDEAVMQSRLATEFTTTDDQVNRIHEIKRGWVATADPAEGQINIQLFRKETPEADRLFLWDMFQTLIHEYMHTLAHSDYSAYAATFGYDSARYNTLIEGVDTLLAEIVWSDIAPRVTDEKLRRQVEGTEYAKLKAIHVPHPEFVRRYPSYAEAVRMSEHVGIANIYAAYFLGDVDKIGA